MPRYKVQIYRRTESGQTYSPEDTNRIWVHNFFCREFAQRDTHTRVNDPDCARIPSSVRVTGGEMRDRTEKEQEGMARFANILLPNYVTAADSTSIWVESLNSKEGCEIYPIKPVWSMLLFYVKYMAIGVGRNATLDRIAIKLIESKNRNFRYHPDQQLGTALFFYAYATHQEQLIKIRSILETGNGPGSAMTRLANLEASYNGLAKEANEIYNSILDEWCLAYKDELHVRLGEHSARYVRKWYMPVLLQDIYNRVYNNDGRFDDVEVSENEW